MLTVSTYNHRLVITTDIAYGTTFTPAGELHAVGRAGDMRRVCTAQGIIDQHAGHRDFVDRIFRKRNPYSITDPFGQQCRHSYSRLHAAILAVAGLCHAKMYRIVHILPVHGCHKHSHGLDHKADI